MITLTDDKGVEIPKWDQTNLRQRRIYFKYNDTGQGLCSGYVRAGDTIIGTFENHSPGLLDITWLNTEFTISALGELVTMTGDKNLDISIELYEPFEYRNSWSFDRFIPGLYHSVAEAFSDLNRNEFQATEPSIAQLIRKATDVVYNPSIRSTDSVAEYLKNVHTALTVQLPNMLYTPSASEIFNTFYKYVINTNRHTTLPRDTDFLLEGTVLTNRFNAGGECMLVNPGKYYSYQSVIISSTDSDDDGIGLVFGERITDTSHVFGIVYLLLETGGSPVVSVRTIELDHKPTHHTPGTAITDEQAELYSRASVIRNVSMTSYPKSNWRSVDWRDGVHISVEFNGTSLNVRVNRPGTKPSDNYELTFTVETAGHASLVDMGGSSGLYVWSQKGSRWSNYAIIRLEE